MAWRISFFILLLVVGLAVGATWLDYQRFVSSPISLASPTTYFDVPKGSSLRGVADRMATDGIVQHPYYLMALAYIQGDQGRLKAGEYELTQDMTPRDLLVRVTSGKVVQFPITLVEGRTFRQVLEVIDAHEQFGREPLSALTDAEIMARLGRAAQHPEGLFFPDTYHFPRRTTGIDVLRRAMERMDQVLAAEWESRDKDLPIASPYEALILASIIEKETAVPSERPAIGGVFVRRLQRGMKLQTDPTVIYGLGERYDGDIRRADLRESTPYNTYVIEGLPPTPIALPGRAAIRAALHPADGDSLYFVARGDGSHVFSRTLNEHNRAVRDYILKPGG